MSGIPDVEAAILHTLAEPMLKQEAQKRWAAQSVNLFLPHKNEISASAAGKCVLEFWAQLHDLLDLPQDYISEAVKMDTGTSVGCRLAALFAVGFEDQFPGFEVDVEVVGEHDGIPGHVEIVVYDCRDMKINDNAPRRAIHMIEIKTSFWGGAVTEDRQFKHSKEFHIIQAAKEALIVSAPAFSVFNVLPAATKRQGAPARHFIQDTFVTADWALAVEVEYKRLSRALGATPPTGDAQEPWRCLSCRASMCERNKNPLNPRLLEAANA
jgi:hypothetical protein